MLTKILKDLFCYKGSALRAGLIVSLIFASGMRLCAQYNMLFTSDYDLPNSLVNKIAEDSHGMVWVATEDGLCRFNGSRFVNYRNQPGNPNSLANNFVRTEYTHANGDVVIGTIGGVQIYRPLTDDFTEILTSTKDNVKSGNVNDIAAGNDGSLIAFGNNCYTLQKVNAEWTVKKNRLTGKVHDVYRGIQTKDGSIWLAYTGSDVQHCTPDGKIRNVKNEDGGSCYATAFCIGPDHRLYIGTADAGIYVYLPQKKVFRHIVGSETLKQVCEMDIIPGTNMLCIATDGTGIRFLDCRTESFVSSQQFIDPLVDISRQKVHSLYIKKNGDVWSALYQKGIFMATHARNVFGYIGHRSSQYDLIGDCCVTSLLQTHDGNIWATTDNGGLYGFTSSFISLRQYPAGVKEDAVPATMLGLYEDHAHRVWFGSFGRGGGMIDLSTGKCQYVYIKGVTGRDFNIYGYAEDKRGQLWVASMGNGILRYDEQQKQFVKYKADDGTLWSGAILYDAPHDRLYCGTYNGIVSFTVGSPKKVTIVDGDAVIYSLSRISKTEIAATSSVGLLILNTNTGKLRTITTADGLPTNNVYAVEMGNDGHLWISSNAGLTHLNLKNMAIETYTMRDGLQGNEFYKNTSLVTHNGRLLFGGINGITVFQPREVDRSHNTCQVRVVDVFAGETYIIANEDGEYIIPSGNDAFTVSFATLPLYMTHRVAYSYSMDGGTWMVLTAPQNKIVFNNLGYGSHKLCVKTTIDGKDTEISETEIYVRYPWYLKWWTVIGWLILLAALAYYIYINVQRRRHMHERLKLHQQEEEMKETKLQFFMNIVHDLRTPLTLIATPLQKLQKSDSDSARQRLYGVMSRNTDRLLQLTNEIMDLRKLDRGKMELDKHLALISKIVRDIVSSMEDISQTRRQQLTMTDHTNGRQMMMVDAQAFEKILTNLLSNALKYTPEGGCINVEWGIDLQHPTSNTPLGSAAFIASAEKEHPKLVLSVTDNGMGIPDEEKKRIFERFYQVRVNGKHVKGTGIGLNLVKALVDLHNGTITVSDNPEGNGTRFTVTIPAEQVQEGDERLKMRDEGVEMRDEGVEMRDDGLKMRDEGVQEVANLPKQGGTGRVSVLIVDDDDDIRNFLCEELSSMYNVYEAADGKAAYDLLNKEKVDLVVSDVMMPEIDGIELTKMIRKNVRLSHLPIVLLTAKTSDQDRIEGLQTTADAYVTKPFNLELLETLIGNLIMRQDKLRNTYSGNELPTDRIETPVVQSADDKLMERLVKVINDNLANPDLTSEMLAREVGLSRVHMYRKLKELTNQSATNYIRNIRLTKAAELLRQGNATISEIAYLVGFRTPAHFSTAFKELYGVTPKEYMKKE